MTTYARIATTGGTTYIQEICPHPSPAGFYTADIANSFVVIPDGTQAGWLKQEDGSFAAPPPAPPPPPPAPARLPLLTPMQFYLAFTPAERIAIKKSGDAEVQEFWATYELAVQLNEMIDPNLSSVSNGLAYLVSQTILTSGRPAQILAGTPQ